MSHSGTGFLTLLIEVRGYGRVKERSFQELIEIMWEEIDRSHGN